MPWSSCSSDVVTPKRIVCLCSLLLASFILAKPYFKCKLSGQHDTDSWRAFLSVESSQGSVRDLTDPLRSSQMSVNDGLIVSQQRCPERSLCPHPGGFPTVWLEWGGMGITLGLCPQPQGAALAVVRGFEGVLDSALGSLLRVPTCSCPGCLAPWAVPPSLPGHLQVSCIPPSSHPSPKCPL